MYFHTSIHFSILINFYEQLTRSCHFNDFRCSLWWKFSQYDIRGLVFSKCWVRQIHISLDPALTNQQLPRPCLAWWPGTHDDGMIYVQCQWRVYMFSSNQYIYSPSGWTSYRKNSRRVEIMRFRFRLSQLVWDLTGISTVSLPKRLSHFRTIDHYSIQFSYFETSRDFAMRCLTVL